MQKVKNGIKPPLNQISTIINPDFILIMKTQKQPPELFCKKGVLRNFAKFTRNCLC